MNAQVHLSILRSTQDHLSRLKIAMLKQLDTLGGLRVT